MEPSSLLGGALLYFNFKGEMDISVCLVATDNKERAVKLTGKNTMNFNVRLL